MVPPRKSQPTTRASQISARSLSRAPLRIQAEHLLVQLLDPAGGGDPGQDEEHPGQAGDRGVGGRGGGEQVTHIRGGLLVQAQPQRQCRHHRPPGQGGRDEQERDGAQQQRGGQQHGLVHEINGVQAGASGRGEADHVASLQRVVLVGGDRGDLGVGDVDLRVVGGQLQVLLVLFGAVVASREREDQRIATLDPAERADGAGVIGQRVIGEDAARDDVGTRGMTATHVASRTRPARRPCRHHFWHQLARSWRNKAYMANGAPGWGAVNHSRHSGLPSVHVTVGQAIRSRGLP
jgi:hypothetical protein